MPSRLLLSVEIPTQSSRSGRETRRRRAKREESPGRVGLVPVVVSGSRGDETRTQQFLFYPSSFESSHFSKSKNTSSLVPVSEQGFRRWNESRVAQPDLIYYISEFLVLSLMSSLCRFVYTRRVPAGSQTTSRRGLPVPVPERPTGVLVRTYAGCSNSRRPL